MLLLIGRLKVRSLSGGTWSGAEEKEWTADQKMEPTGEASKHALQVPAGCTPPPAQHMCLAGPSKSEN